MHQAHRKTANMMAWTSNQKGTTNFLPAHLTKSDQVIEPDEDQEIDG